MDVGINECMVRCDLMYEHNEMILNHQRPKIDVLDDILQTGYCI